jgi:acyl-CoA thioester hydrolase
MKTRLELQVRYQETDQMARVYHANYFTWFDLARTEFLREHGISYKQMEQDGIFFVVAETGCQYFSWASFDDQIQIITSLTEIKKVSVSFAYEVLLKATQKKICTGYTKLGAVDKNGKIVKIPALVLERLTRE